MTAIFYVFAVTAIVAGCMAVFAVVLSAHRMRRERRFAQALSVEALNELIASLLGLTENAGAVVSAVLLSAKPFGYSAALEEILSWEGVVERPPLSAEERAKARNRFLYETRSLYAQPLRRPGRSDSLLIPGPRSLSQIPLEVYASDPDVRANVSAGLALIDAFSREERARSRHLG